jgi:hypothetical protein
LETLVRHFEEAENDPVKDKNNRCMHMGLQRKSTSTEFISDMGIMCNALQELSELSLELQDQKINLYQEDVNVRALVLIFEECMAIPRNYYGYAAIPGSKLSF